MKPGFHIFNYGKNQTQGTMAAAMIHNNTTTILKPNNS